MKDTDVLVLSRHLSVDSFEASTGRRVIANTDTGQRLELGREAAKILDVFRTPQKISSAARQLGLAGRANRQKLHSLLSPLIEASFLVPAIVQSANHAGALFRKPETSFANCPTPDVSEIEQGSIAIAGIASDQAVTGHPGTRYGPDRLREVSRRFISYELDVVTLKSLGFYSADLGKTVLKDVVFADLGNVVTHLSEDPRTFYDRCYRAALSIHSRKALPVFIGGDHSISAPLVRAATESHGDLTIVHFDAHTDMADFAPPAEHHHGNVMSRVLQENAGVRIIQYGIRGFTKEPSLHPRWQIVSQRTIDTELPTVLADHVPRGQKCYLSVDVDVLDPAVAPGTGTPLPLGMEPKTLLHLLEAVASRNTIVGVDITELCPPLDQHDLTTSLIFHVLMRLLASIHHE